jgi:hypothetical protein
MRSENGTYVRTRINLRPFLSVDCGLLIQMIVETDFCVLGLTCSNQRQGDNVKASLVWIEALLRSRVANVSEDILITRGRRVPG